MIKSLESMTIASILLVSVALFGYWFKRVEMLLHRPHQQRKILDNDLSRSRNILDILRSMLLPVLAGTS